MTSHSITMLGAGFIGDFYAMTLHGQRNRDRVGVAYSRSRARADAFAARWDVPIVTTDLEAAVGAADTDVVVVALPNHLHEEAVNAAARAGTPVLGTKTLGRNAAEVHRSLKTAKSAGGWRGFL